MCFTLAGRDVGFKQICLENLQEDMDLELNSESGEETSSLKTPKKETAQDLKSLLSRESKFLDTCREVKVMNIRLLRF